MRYPVYLIDDDSSVRAGLTLLFEAHGIAVRDFDGAAPFLDAAGAGPPGIVLCDLKMPQVTGLDLCRLLANRGIDWPVVMITGHGDIESCRSAFRFGVVDFLTKPFEDSALFAALDAAEARLRTVLERDEARALVDSLTQREREIFQLICRGLETKEIAQTLDISNRTIDTHRSHIGRKLGTTSVAEFVAIARLAE